MATPAPPRPTGKRIRREAVLRWVPIADMRVSPLAQRDLNQSRVNKLAAEFDPEQVGTPTVNLRGGAWYIIDGQHRIDAMRAIGWDDQLIQCWTYEGLTEQEEAEKFLKLNDYLVVRAYAKFVIALTAERPEETDINKIVQSCGLHVSTNRTGG